VVKDKVRYCGSPIKYAVRESSNRNSITIVDFKEKGNVTFEIVPLKPLRNLRKIKGTIEEVRRHAIDTDDYVDVTLTDEEHIINAMGKLREVYPHVLRLTYENAQTNGLKLSTGNASASGVEDKTVAELFSDFLKDVYGRDLEDNPNDVQAVAEVITKLDMEEHA
jgi:exonuclease SbcD